MSDERKKELRRSIRRLTAKIGEAKKANDFNEIENLRIQRSKFFKQLVEEFGEGMIVENGKTVFKSIEEIHVHYEDPAQRQKVMYADAATAICQQRRHMKMRETKMMGLSGEEVKKWMLDEVASALKELETMANKVKAQIGEPPIDWAQVDAKQKADDDFLSGIDTSSLS